MAAAIAGGAAGEAVVGALRAVVGVLWVAAGVGMVEAAAASAAAAAAVAHAWNQEKLRPPMDQMGLVRRLRHLGLVRRLPRAVKAALPQEVSRHVLSPLVASFVVALDFVSFSHAPAALA